MGAVLGFLKTNSFWKILERITANDFLNTTLGENGYKTVWEPLLKAKFGPFYKTVNAAWFWARIKKRSPQLGYFKGGFQGFANHVSELLIKNGVNAYYQSPINKLVPCSGKVKVVTSTKSSVYDKVVVTVANNLFLKLVDGFPKDYEKQLKQLQSLDALVCIFELKEKLMDKVYWLNVLDSNHPFVVITEHTNMIPAKHYNNHCIVYVGGYFPKDHNILSYANSKIINLAKKQLSEMFPHFQKNKIINSQVYRASSAQPVFPVSFSKDLLDFQTPIPNIYLANLSMVYPWDRGTNYAVRLGENLAKFIIEKN
jgi:protoporphyrinogen oxidase